MFIAALYKNGDWIFSWKNLNNFFWILAFFFKQTARHFVLSMVKSSLK
jgi:hypothetical protein